MLPTPPGPLLRHMVDPTRGPGVAAHQSPDCQEEPLDRAVGAYRPQSISRTAGVVPTRGSAKWRDEPLIAADSSHQEQGEEPSNGHVPYVACTETQLPQSCHRDTTAAVPARCPSLALARPRHALTSADNSPLDAALERGSARITTSVPGARSSTWAAMRCRSCRATRCRTTDPPTDRPTMNPARASPAESVTRTCTTRVGEAALVPLRNTVRKSSARRILRRTGSTDVSWLLGREARATLAAARGQNATSSAGAHPGPEPVRAGTPTVVRLERALHGVILAAG